MAGTDTNKVTINVNGTNLEFTKIGNILGPSGKDGIDGKSIYAKTVDPWSVSGWNPAVAGDLFLNTTTGILWSAKAGAVTSNVKSNWTKVGELAGKITVDSALSSTSTNPVQNKVIKSALNKKADSGHTHSYLMNSSGRQFNVPTGGNGGEQKTLVITDDLNAYQPAGNYASSTHKHPISDINDLQSTIDGINTDMGLQDEAIARKADENHAHPISDITGLQTALDGKAGSSHSHSSLTNSSGRQFNVPTGGNGGEQKTLVITDDLNAYQPAGNYASSTHKHPISDITGLYDELTGMTYVTDSSDNSVQLETYGDGNSFSIPTKGYVDSALNGKSNLDHNHDSVYQAKGDYATNDTLKSYVTGTTFIDYTTYIEGEVNKKANISHDHTISNITGLQSALDGKSNTGHTHSEYVTGTDFSAYTNWIEGEVNKKADVGHTHKKSDITDLSIPTVNNPTITINQGGTKKGSFTLNQSGSATINLTDNNTTYTAGTGLSLSGTTFSVSSANVSTMMNLLSEGTSDPTDNDYYISQWAGGGMTTTTYHRRPVSKLYNYMKGKFDSIYQAKGSYAASSHTHNYLPLSGGAMTGAISYKGTKATYGMIKWIDNTGDIYGNGIRIGGGGATIIGGGESSDLPSVSGGDEVLYLMNDGNIDFYSNCQDGLSSAKHMSFDTSGNLNVPTNVDAKTISADTINGHTLGNAILRQNASSGEVIIGSTVRPLRLWGNQTRPSYSKNDGASYSELALKSDIPTKLPASNISMSFSNGVLTITYN